MRSILATAACLFWLSACSSTPMQAAWRNACMAQAHWLYPIPDRLHGRGELNLVTDPYYALVRFIHIENCVIAGVGSGVFPGSGTGVSFR